MFAALSKAAVAALKSSCGASIYLNLAGSCSVRWLDLTTRTLGPQFWLGEYIQLDENNSRNDALRVMSDMRVVPGGGVSSVVTRDEVAVYKDGVRRPATTGIYSNIKLLAPATSSTLYGIDFVGDLVTLAMSDAGVSEASDGDAAEVGPVGREGIWSG